MAAYEPLVETTRGGIVESVHHGALAIVDAAGGLRWSIGDPRLISFPRSSLKPFQLLALVAGGGVERFGLEPAEVAVGSASHTGEEVHVDAVCRLLEKIDAPPTALACGVHPPIDAEAANRLSKRGEAPSAVHNNCSGKHAAMLALARLLGAPLEGYIDPDHPAQRAIRVTLIEVLGLDADRLTMGIDGCSAPAYAVPLDRLARGFALLGNPAAAPPQWRQPFETIARAMRARPELVAGTAGRIDTDVMRAADGAVVAKGGAEGYFGMGHSDGLGAAFKIMDGDPSHRARFALVAGLAEQLNWLPAGTLPSFGPTRPITNWAGRETGVVRLAAALDRVAADR